MRGDEITVINPEIKAITKNTQDSKNNTVLYFLFLQNYQANWYDP